MKREDRFSRRVRSIQVSAIKQMPLLARGVPDAVSLGQGIPAVRTPACIRRAVMQLLDESDSIGKYSLQPGVPELKHGVAALVSERAQRPVDAEREIYISAGAMEALFTALVSIVDEGDEVILFDPSYASHIEQVLFAGGRPVYVPLTENDGWGLESEKLRSAITPRTKAIVVCSPGNPTGKCFTKSELQSVVDLAVENDLFIIADETYDFLVYDERPFISLLSFPDARERLIACYSFSKQFAMTGWRVGYMYAPEDVVAQALKVHDAALICAPTISQYAALAAIRERFNPECGEVKRTLTERRAQICERLDRLAPNFSYVKPQGAYYVLVRYHEIELDSAAFALRLLHEARVITIPGRAFGPSGEHHIRLSFGGTAAEINEAFDRIEVWQQTA